MSRDVAYVRRVALRTEIGFGIAELRQNPQDHYLKFQPRKHSAVTVDNPESMLGMIPKGEVGVKNLPLLVGKVEGGSRYREESAEEWIVQENKD